ncbi:hypothetical protein [Falsigemmobacter faecalis]|uniref:hypothetical protein n=1 Tax=Falsigemmobacter faecalis TaxID=2488730 RepID=UPI00131580D6|nr:hypothetical protein [Falsigemmobacter faecalis]
MFVPVGDDLPSEAPGPDAELQIGIGLRNGRQLRYTPGISPAVPARLIQVLEAA